VGRPIALDVPAGGADLDQDAGEPEFLALDLAQDPERQIPVDQDRDEGRIIFDFLTDGFLGFRVQFQEAGEGGQGAFGVGGVLRDQVEPIGRAVVGDDPAGPVQEGAPGRRQDPGTNPVLFGEITEGGAVINLQVPEFGQENKEKRPDQDDGGPEMGAETFPPFGMDYS
jgi:hypothetical protein